MKVRSFSHVGITVSDFNRFVQFYWEVFGCPLVGVADTPPERVRSFFKVAGRGAAVQDRVDSCAGRRRPRDFRISAAASARPDSVEPCRPDAFQLQRAEPAEVARPPGEQGRGDASATPERSPRGHSFFFAKDFDGNLIELMDLGYMYHVLGWLGPLGGWLFRRGMYKQYYEPKKLIRLALSISGDRHDYPAEEVMKYLCLIYDEEKKFAEMSKSEMDSMMGEYRAFGESIKSGGQYIGGHQLAPVHTASTVRVRNGKVSTTDGPFAETKEQLGGYYLIEARDLNEAIQIASRIPSAKSGSIEVRPIHVSNQASPA